VLKSICGENCVKSTVSVGQVFGIGACEVKTVPLATPQAPIRDVSSIILAAIEKPGAVGRTTASYVKCAAALRYKRAGSATNAWLVGGLFRKQGPVDFLSVPKLLEPSLQTIVGGRHSIRLV
jgi:hypothetical protein